MRIDYFILKSIKKIYKKLFNSNKVEPIEFEKDPNVVYKELIGLITSDKPIMVARYGATELLCIVNYINIKKGRPNLREYFNIEDSDWWWADNKLRQIEELSGFFPATIENVERFCELMIDDSGQVDALASWIENEKYMQGYIADAYRFQGLLLDPFWSDTPWTVALKGKKVLVIHPFESTIISQYKKRELLFTNPDILPEFELKTIKAVQSLGGNSEYSTWFEALDYMKSEIDKIDFDICLIGAGAYGFPLAAYVKRKGKKAIHMGGSLQLIFGIRGKRWENENYNEVYNYSKLMNEYWVKPAEQEKPRNASNVEGACYW